MFLVCGVSNDGGRDVASNVSTDKGAIRLNEPKMPRVTIEFCNSTCEFFLSATSLAGRDA
jgi:hypothetical protein